MTTPTSKIVQIPSKPKGENTLRTNTDNVKNELQYTEKE